MLATGKHGNHTFAARSTTVDRCQGASSPKADVGHRNRTNDRLYIPAVTLCAKLQFIVLIVKNRPADFLQGGCQL